MAGKFETIVGVGKRLAAVAPLMVLTAMSCATVEQLPETDPALAIARQHYSEGKFALARGDAMRAVAEFEAARAIRPAPTIDYSLGFAYERAGRPAEALSALRSFLATAPLNAPGRALAASRVVALEAGRSPERFRMTTPPTPSDSREFVIGAPTADYTDWVELTAMAEDEVGQVREQCAEGSMLLTEVRRLRDAVMARDRSASTLATQFQNDKRAFIARAREVNASINGNDCAGAQRAWNSIAQLCVVPNHRQLESRIASCAAPPPAVAGPPEATESQQTACPPLTEQESECYDHVKRSARECLGEWSKELIHEAIRSALNHDHKFDGNQAARDGMGCVVDRLFGRFGCWSSYPTLLKRGVECP